MTLLPAQFNYTCTCTSMVNRIHLIPSLKIWYNLQSYVMLSLKFQRFILFYFSIVYKLIFIITESSLCAIHHFSEILWKRLFVIVFIS
jgi:hypothetical protein